MRKVASFAERKEMKRLEQARADLPPADTIRWVASRKAAIVKAVDMGAISESEVCARYHLSVEELTNWRESLAEHGKGALLVTKLKHFRNSG